MTFFLDEGGADGLGMTRRAVFPAAGFAPHLPNPTAFDNQGPAILETEHLANVGVLTTRLVGMVYGLKDRTQCRVKRGR